MSLPVKRPQVFRHGSRWEFHFRPKFAGQVMDLTGYTGEMVIVDMSGAQVARFTNFEVGQAADFARIELTPDQVGTIPESAGSYAIFLTPPTGAEYTESWFEGPVRVIPKGRHA